MNVTRSAELSQPLRGRKAVRGIDRGCARVVWLTQSSRIDLDNGPSPPSKGEREGPVAREPSAYGLDPWGREGEVGSPADRPPSPCPLPPAGGGRGKKERRCTQVCVANLCKNCPFTFPRTALPLGGEGRVRGLLVAMPSDRKPH